MRAIAINGSPRKDWNTAILLDNALKGAESGGSETELVHLYDLDYKGCVSCFKCKRKGGKNYAKCASEDELTPVLEKIEKADILIMGAPIYMGSISGEMKSFLERLLFQYHIYAFPSRTSYEGNIKVGFIYDMGMNKERFDSALLKYHTESNDAIIRRIFGNLETVYCFDTYQMDDYTGIEYGIDIEKKRERRKSEFPKDCEKAFEMGRKLVSGK